MLRMCEDVALCSRKKARTFPPWPTYTVDFFILFRYILQLLLPVLLLNRHRQRLHLSEDDNQ